MAEPTIEIGDAHEPSIRSRNADRHGYDAVGKPPEPQLGDEANVLQTVLSAISNRFGPAAVTELQPIIDALATSTREERARNRTKRDGSLRRAPSGGLDARQLLLVNGAIDEMIAEPITVSMLSSIAGLSRSHFSNAFRQTVGRSPHEHILGLRIERAMKHMLDTDAPLSEVAVASGFCDQAHFANRFRRTVGMTPMKWRRLHQPAQARA